MSENADTPKEPIEPEESSTATATEEEKPKSYDPFSGIEYPETGLFGNVSDPDAINPDSKVRSLKGKDEFDYVFVAPYRTDMVINIVHTEIEFDLATRAPKPKPGLILYFEEMDLSPTQKMGYLQILDHPMVQNGKFHPDDVVAELVTKEEYGGDFFSWRHWSFKNELNVRAKQLSDMADRKLKDHIADRRAKAGLPALGGRNRFEFSDGRKVSGGAVPSIPVEPAINPLFAQEEVEEQTYKFKNAGIPTGAAIAAANTPETAAEIDMGNELVNLSAEDQAEVDRILAEAQGRAPGAKPIVPGDPGPDYQFKGKEDGEGSFGSE